jgi:phosphoribosylanthranilate isomerase
MFRIKICGITNVEDATAAVEAGADAIGLNFYEKSPRFVAPESAMQIAQAMTSLAARGTGARTRSTVSGDVKFFRPEHRPPKENVVSECPLVVGVFVNLERPAVKLIVETLALSAIQLHGDESPEAVAYFAKPQSANPYPEQSEHPFRWAVVRARRMDEQGVAAIAADLQACREAGWPPAAILVDALSPNRYGGTGETVSWVGLADHKKWLGDTPLILAGGLTPENVAEAIRIVRPHAVDVAGGVESAPGKKDPHKVRDFIAAAKAAFGI